MQHPNGSYPRARRYSGQSAVGPRVATYLLSPEVEPSYVQSPTSSVAPPYRPTRGQIHHRIGPRSRRSRHGCLLLTAFYEMYTLLIGALCNSQPDGPQLRSALGNLVDGIGLLFDEPKG